MEYRYSEAVRISYEVTGSGDKPLFLFHGFGLTKESFRPWFPQLEGYYQLIAVDLFYHGDSIKSFSTLGKSEWVDIFKGFLVHLALDCFSVCGFSLGGRFAIPVALELPDRCKELILVAPDAIYKTPWFTVATHPAFRWLFKYYMGNDRALKRLLRRSVKTKIVNRYIADFVEKELGEPENRHRVYYSWNHFKPLGYSKSDLRSKLTHTSFMKLLILGTKDIVIPPKKILPIIDDCGFRVFLLEKKHHQLMSVVSARIIVENQSG